MAQLNPLSCPKCGAPDYFVRNSRGALTPFWLCWRCNHTDLATLEDWKNHGITSEEWLARVEKGRGEC